MMTELQASNLLNVATALRGSIKPHMFTMARYANFDWEKFTSWFKEGTSPKDKEVIARCGSPACALGHYASRDDLQSTFYLGYNTDGVISASSDRSVQLNGTIVRKEFGVSMMEAERLFGSRGCGEAETALEAAEYIENFLNIKGWVPA